MKLQFRSNYLSIYQFNPVELPDFAIITGLNGSGKTHLLNALKNGAVTADDISQLDIDYYSYQDFLVQSSGQSLTGQQIDQQRHGKGLERNGVV